MGNLVLTDSQNYTNIANAIRAKAGTLSTYTPAEMPAAISAISGGVTPSGVISITENGMHDVTSYASASVSVPVGVFPTGTSNISENGVYDISTYASVSVNVPEPDYNKRWTDNANFKTFTDASVTIIPYGTFAYTINLSTVSFPEAVTISNYAFGYCFKLQNGSFPKVKTIGTYAFQYCSSFMSGQVLNSSVFPSLSGTLGGYAFRGCQYITGVSLPNITSLGAQAFSACSRITSVDLPKVTHTAAGVFSYLTTCTGYSLPELKVIGSSAFYSN